MRWPWSKPKDERNYKGYPFVKYDVDGAPLYDFGGFKGGASAKFIDWCFGGPPPGKGTHVGYRIEGWRWDGSEWWQV